jgi:hypothetical protein
MGKRKAKITDLVEELLGDVRMGYEIDITVDRHDLEEVLIWAAEKLGANQLFREGDEVVVIELDKNTTQPPYAKKGAKGVIHQTFNYGDESVRVVFNDDPDERPWYMFKTELRRIIE